MIKIKESQIEAEGLFCPYCFSEKKASDIQCCGESCEHFERGYVINDNIILESEVEIQKGE